MPSFTSSVVAGLLSAVRIGQAINLDLSDASSIKSAAASIASDIATIYAGHRIPGIFPSPYFWWESGLAFDTLVNYWALTGDDTYNAMVQEGLLFQMGPADNYMPPNQTSTEGNDDQSTWALAAMTAAERGFPSLQPSAGSNDSWLQLAQNVFDVQVARWDDTTCNGGLRWQIFSFNAGFDYKNSMSVGNFLQLASRLARFTGNDTYSDWAQKALSWTTAVDLLDSSTGAVFDGADTTTNCSSVNHIQWTGNAGTYLAGVTSMANTTGGDTLLALAAILVENVRQTFASSNTSAGVLTEVACAPSNNCNTDDLAFRAILARALASTRDFALASPAAAGNASTSALSQTINHILQASAQGAAGQCTGGPNGTLCGNDWSSTRFDGSTGLGQELSALAVVLANLPAVPLRTANSTGSAATGTGTGTNGTEPSGVASGASSSASSSATATASNGVEALAASTLTVIGAVAFAVVLGV